MIMDANKIPPTLDQICDIVCSYYQMEKQEVFRNTPKRINAGARQMFHYLAKTHTDYGYSDIGRYYGDVNGWYISHSTVMHSKKAITNQLSYSKSMVKRVDFLNKKIKKSAKPKKKQVEKIDLNLFKMEFVKMIVSTSSIEELKERATLQIEKL